MSPPTKPLDTVQSRGRGAMIFAMCRNAACRCVQVGKRRLSAQSRLPHTCVPLVTLRIGSGICAAFVHMNKSWLFAQPARQAWQGISWNLTRVACKYHAALRGEEAHRKALVHTTVTPSTPTMESSTRSTPHSLPKIPTWITSQTTCQTLYSNSATTDRLQKKRRRPRFSENYL